jgi:nucleotide-binding universal stress UspA family protein
MRASSSERDKIAAVPIRRILVALDGSPESDSAVRHALDLGRLFGARVDALHVVDLARLDASFVADLSASVGFQPFLNLTGELHEALRGMGREIAAAFEAKRGAAGVEGQARVEEGLVVDRIQKAASTADVVLLGARGVGARRGHALGGHTDALLRRASRPAIVCPAEYRAIRSPAAAFDGSERSARALSITAEIASRLKHSLGVLSVGSDSAEQRERRLAAERLAAAQSAEIVFTTRSGDPEKAILETLGDFDLIGMGSHGHGRIVEMVLGSTTESVLRGSPIPVLCAP